MQIEERFVTKFSNHSEENKRGRHRHHERCRQNVWGMVVKCLCTMFNDFGALVSVSIALEL